MRLLSKKRKTIKNKKQKGSGFFNVVKKIFTRKSQRTVQNWAKPKNLTQKKRRVDQKQKQIYNLREIKNKAKFKNPCDMNPNERPDLPDEQFLPALDRSIAFMYNKMYPDSPKTFKISRQEKQKMRMVIYKARQEISADSEIYFEELATKLFGDKISLNKFNDELYKFEHYPAKFSDKFTVYNGRVLNYGTNFKRCAYSVSGSLPRLISLIMKSDRQQQYMANHSDNICSLPSGNPITTLDSDECIYIIRDKEQLRMLEEGVASNTLLAPYILIDKMVFPVEQHAQAPINIKANRLLATSFIIDAFEKKMVYEVEASLANVLRTEAPELWSLSKLDVYICYYDTFMKHPNIKNNKYIILIPNTNIVLPSEGWKLFQLSNVLNAGEKSIVYEAFKQYQVYGVEESLEKLLKEKNPELWKLKNTPPSFDDLNENNIERRKMHFGEIVENVKNNNIQQFNTPKFITKENNNVPRSNNFKNTMKFWKNKNAKTRKIGKRVIWRNEATNQPLENVRYF